MRESEERETSEKERVKDGGQTEREITRGGETDKDRSTEKDSNRDKDRDSEIERVLNP